MTILIAGATGFIGQKLVKRLHHSGHKVIALSRNPRRAEKKLGESIVCKRWNGTDISDWSGELEGCDAVINLMGEDIAGKRWSEQRKKELYESRVDNARIMTGAIKKASNPPSVYIQSSAIGYYSLQQTEPVQEDGEQGTHFVARLTADWEQAAQALQDTPVRCVFLRTGLVLHPDGGVLQKMLLPFKLFVGGPLGHGRQGFSWIHMDDMTAAVEFILENKKLSGPFNFTAPQPVDMNTFARSLGRAMGRPSVFRVPGFMLKILLGELSSEVTSGVRIIPAGLQKSGYKFKYENIDDALNDLV